MKTQRRRQFVTFSLVLAAVAFGMVLAGGLSLTPSGNAAPAPQAAPPTTAVGISSHPTVVTGLPSFADLAAKVSPAVVSVRIAKIEKGGGAAPYMDPFQFFFGPQGQQGPQQRQPRRRQEALGSGFIISPDGYVVTNNHVISGATEVDVYLGDRQYRAKVKGADPSTDLALLKIQTNHPLPTVPLGNSDAIRPGDWVMAVGSPLGFRNSVTVGVVSAKGRQIDITPDHSLEDFIQTDAAINFGNSGGPLVNVEGQVVGINTAINAGSENIGFAVPVNTLKEILPQLESKGKVTRGYLGINVQDLNYERMKAFGLNSSKGALITSVVSGGPSDSAGLKHGDVILGIDGHELKDTHALIFYVSSKEPGTKVRLKINRGGKILERVVTLGTRPEEGQPQTSKSTQGSSGIDWLGLQYQNLTPGLRQGHGIPSGVNGVVITDVGANSPLYDQDVRPGDVVTEVNGHKVGDIEQFEATVKKAKSGTYLRFYVQRFNPRSRQQLSFFAVVRVP